MYCKEQNLKKRNTNNTSTTIQTQYCCGIVGCHKAFRTVTRREKPDGNLISQYSIEEIEEDEHDHSNIGLQLRGLTADQKSIILKCFDHGHSKPKEVVAEFEKLRSRNIELMVPSVPVPPKSQITSFLGQHRTALRGGRRFRETSLGDIDAYALSLEHGKSISSYIYIYIYV
mmetsp:Transcript_24030/g.23097  ORF Transcript_24030/g.23097 Transcript_24030/m.23097 type:complete len:172 (+) Transcript_24030:179-694(+)